MRETRIAGKETLLERFDRWYSDEDKRANLHVAFSGVLAGGLLVLFLFMMAG